MLSTNSPRTTFRTEEISPEVFTYLTKRCIRYIEYCLVLVLLKIDIKKETVFVILLAPVVQNTDIYFVCEQLIVETVIWKKCYGSWKN